MKFRANLWIGGGLVVLAVGVAILAPYIATHDPVMDANLMVSEEPPSRAFFFA